MEEALYSPEGGYYNSPNRIGASGDFFTSPSAHPIFGALIAIQVTEMWEVLGKPKPFTILEFGAGQGLLSNDLVSCLKFTRNELFENLNYVAVDRSTYSVVHNPKVNWILSNGSPFTKITGCIISNELLDSFPVHRFKIQDKQIKEILVGVSEHEFTEILSEVAHPELREYLNKDYFGEFPDGFQGEVNLMISPWLKSIADSLERGFILTIDYGATEEKLYSLQNFSGSLRCFYNHTITGNPYQRIGQQDITSNVNFSSVIELGEMYGLTTLGLTTQREFLTNLGVADFLYSLAQRQRPNNSPKIEVLTQKEYLANRMATLQLLDPDGLGAFKVLIQGKQVTALQLSGIQSNSKPSETQNLTFPSSYLPLRDSNRTPLFEGRFPDQALIPDDIWPWA